MGIREEERVDLNISVRPFRAGTQRTLPARPRPLFLISAAARTFATERRLQVALRPWINEHVH